MANCVRGGVHYRRHQYRKHPTKYGYVCKACDHFQPAKVIKRPRPLVLTLTKFRERFIQPWAARMADAAEATALKEYASLS